MKTLEDALAAIEQMKTAFEAEKTALKNKNSELIDREKAAKDRADEAENATGTELEKANKRAEKAERDAKAANDRATSSEKGLREYKRDAAISAAIAGANVDSKHVAILTKALKSDVEFDDAGEPLIAGKAIDAYAKSYFAKEGADYVRAADHNGGGATGSEGSKAGVFSKPPETPEELHNWMKYTTTNREEAVALSKQWQRSDLHP